MRGGRRIKGVEVKRGKRNLKEADQGQDPGLETGGETGQGPETEEETGAGETGTDLPEETGAPGSTDQTPHRAMMIGRVPHLITLS
jgi:hypothetical protein